MNKTIVVGAGLLAVAAGAAAQDNNARRNDGQTLSPIEVWGVVPADTDSAPAAVSELTAEDIETLRPYTLHDALKFIPGVRTLDDDILGRRSGIGVRGAPTRRSRQVLLLEDGTPINAATYLDASAHYTPPTERLERIEVIKASGQVKNGPLNNHGIINFRSIRGTPEPRTRLEAAFGNQDTQRQHVSHQRTDGDLASAFSYTRLKADGTFDVEDTHYQDFYANADWKISARHEMSGSALYFRERSHYDESNLTPQEYAAAPRTKAGRFGQEHNTIAVDYLKFDLMHRFAPSEAFSLSTRAFHTNLDRPRFTVDPGEYVVGALPDLVLDDGDGAFVPGPSGNGQMISRDRHYRNYGLENRAELRLDGGHTLEWGLRAERQTFDDRRTEGDVGQILTPGNRGELTRDEQYRSWAMSAFVQDQIVAGDWTFVPGLRAERYTQHRQRVFPTLDPKESEKRSVLLPGVSVLYDGFDNAQLFGSVERGYTPAIARGSSFPLRPEIGINSQLGLRAAPASGVSIDAAVFYNRLRNTLVQLPYIDPDTFASVYVNEANSRAFGVDLGARVDSAAFTGSALNLFAAVAWNYTNAKFTGGDMRGNRVPEIPLHFGSLTLGMEHRAGWHASLTLSHEGRFFTDPANTGAPLLVGEDCIEDAECEPLGAGDAIDLREPIVLGAVPSRTLLSARVSYRLTDGASLWVQGRNLTDKQYVADFQNGMRPGAPRTVVAGVTVVFD